MGATAGPTFLPVLPAEPGIPVEDARERLDAAAEEPEYAEMGRTGEGGGKISKYVVGTRPVVPEEVRIVVQPDPSKEVVSSYRLLLSMELIPSSSVITNSWPSSMEISPSLFAS